MPHAIESFRKGNEVMEELTLVLQMFLNDDSAVEDLLHCAPSSSESCPLPEIFLPQDYALPTPPLHYVWADFFCLRLDWDRSQGDWSPVEAVSCRGHCSIHSVCLGLRYSR
ncbi:hypothetical protein DPMN_164456 [Dreissena polymorpha]|uniref:Uncharacterized protein n=1 Tax=Dreissena polymorpha TaxID=45954 RepID=A0A9D4IVF6_DREPO|nr:hypothetical protein DPMN_164456 [Dreissena polymorpha]